MREFAEFRILEKNASLVLREDEGVRLSNTVRKLIVETNHPLYKIIGEINNTLQKDGEYLFLGWDLQRKYTKNELNSASIFQLIITAVFEPTGEECGTVYDESTACKICEAGRTQVSDLILDLRKVPKKKDIARTIANEWIVSQRLAEMFMDNNITGFVLKPLNIKLDIKTTQ
jgi:hypothetical protein